jgi:hypothetical protein
MSVILCCMEWHDVLYIVVSVVAGLQYMLSERLFLSHVLLCIGNVFYYFVLYPS